MSEPTATDAARSFSRVLDDVEHHQRSFVITRAGRVVAAIGPAGPRTMTVGELLAHLRAAPQVDADFAGDVDAARRQVGLPPAPGAWDR